MSGRGKASRYSAMGRGGWRILRTEGISEEEEKDALLHLSPTLYLSREEEEGDPLSS